MESYSKKVSMTVVRRLPRYYRYLRELEKKGVEKISSQELAKLMGLTASQIRQDLNSFGAYGQQGYGYKVTELKEVIKSLLGLNSNYHCILIGAGNMGQALARYGRYRNEGIIVEAMFDKNPENVKDPGDSLLFHSDNLEDYLSKHQVDIAILTVPAEAGQEMANRVVKGGVKSILNFVPIDLNVPEDVVVSDVNITDSFYTLTYLLTED